MYKAIVFETLQNIDVKHCARAWDRTTDLFDVNEALCH